MKRDAIALTEETPATETPLAELVRRIAAMPVASAPSGQNVHEETQRRIREARREYSREWKRAKRRGEKLPKGVFHQPGSGVMTPLLNGISTGAPAVSAERFRSRRERALELQARMREFAPIYNAGWMVRDAYFASDERRRAKVEAFFAVLVQSMQQTDDYEALLFAVADTIYASPSGVPWEP